MELAGIGSGGRSCSTSVWSGRSAPVGISNWPMNSACNLRSGSVFGWTQFDASLLQCSWIANDYFCVAFLGLLLKHAEYSESPAGELRQIPERTLRTHFVERAKILLAEKERQFD